MTDGSRSIMVACVDPDIREVLARVVETANLEAVRLEPETDVAEAVVTARSAGLVLDLGAGNQAALRTLRERSEDAAQQARVIVIGTGPAGGRLAWQGGADGYLVRPFHARELQQALTETLALDDAGREARRQAGTEALTS